MMNIKMLGISVPGTPGEDYPIFSSVPSTSFTCDDKEGGGYYADMETGCQVHHTCGTREDLQFIKFSTLCPNGTIFDQEGQTCRWWYMVDCESSESFYFSETNIRGSEVSSIPFSGDFDSEVSQVNFPTVADPPRRNQISENRVQENRVQENRVQENRVPENKVQENTGNSITGNNIYLAIPEGALSDQLFNLIRDQQIPARRVPNPEVRVTQVRGNRRQNPTIRTRQVFTGNRTPNRRTQQTRNDLINSGIQPRIEPKNNAVEDDYDFYAEEDNNAGNNNNIRPTPTLPPAKRDFSFVNGKIVVKGG